MTRWLATIAWLAGCLGWAVPPPGTAPASVGYLDERGLAIHEAWFEARLSMGPQPLEAEWARLVSYLKTSLRGRARVTVTGNSSKWQIDLKPFTGPMSVQVNPDGARVIAEGDPDAREPRTLVELYPWRRHYDCDGRPLNPARRGIPVTGRPCPPPKQEHWYRFAGPLKPADGIVVQPVSRLARCYRIVSVSGGDLLAGQVLVEDSKDPYKMQRLEDDKLRLRYSENRRMFVMDRKEPKVYITF